VATAALSGRWVQADAPAATPDATPVHVQIDWQAHPSMHIPWPMFGRGLTDRSLSRRTWKHQFRQTMSAEATLGSGTRLVLAAAMAAERAHDPTQARRLILRQLRHLEAFIAAHPERAALARTPAEARRLLATTDKVVFVHSIEGGHLLLERPGDAAFWAQRGVALITLIHLRDKENGGSALLPGALGRGINPVGARATRRGERRGLTGTGRRNMRDLHDAGILVDLSHMTPTALDDALDVAEAHGVPPVITHAALDSVKPGGGGLRDDQLLRMYALGGVFSHGLSALETVTGPDHALPEGGPCPGTVEAWAWQHQHVQRLIEDNAGDLLGQPELAWADLDEDQRTRLSTGWSSDWNGWVSHSRPVVGTCRDAQDGDLALDRKGLAHPGLLPEHWQRVEEQGVSLEPMLRTSERFLQLWEQARGER
jgi:microsomal dipeptidase-like Zn-dependent dipeptidase